MELAKSKLDERKENMVDNGIEGKEMAVQNQSGRLTYSGNEKQEKEMEFDDDDDYDDDDDDYDKEEYDDEVENRGFPVVFAANRAYNGNILAEPESIITNRVDNGIKRRGMDLSAELAYNVIFDSAELAYNGNKLADESKIKNSIQGVVRTTNKRVGKEDPNPRMGARDLVLRVLAFTLSLVAAIVIGLDKPPNVSVSAKWHYMSAVLYFMVTNAIACAYAALSLLLLIAKRGKSKGLGAFIAVLDAFMVALLFSGKGAAAVVSYLGYKENSHVQWNEMCNVFGKFCDQMAASIVVSLLASIVFLLLLLSPLWRLHTRT